MSNTKQKKEKEPAGTDITLEANSVNNLEDLRWLPLKFASAVFDGREFNRHKNPNGKLGGFVEKSATVCPTAYVGKNALVTDEAVLKGSTCLTHQSLAGGTCKLFNAALGDESVVYGNSIIYRAYVGGNASVYNSSLKGKNIHVGGDAKISWSTLSGNLSVYGDVRIFGDDHVVGPKVGFRIINENTIIGLGNGSSASQNAHNTGSVAHLLREQ